MKMGKTFLLLGVLVLLGSWFYWQQGQETSAPLGKLVIPLEEINPKPINKWDKGNETVGTVKFSPDGKYLAIASQEGRLRLVEVKTGKIVHQLRLGIGYFRALTFSADSKYLYLGESSPDGYVYCLSIPEGKKIWQYGTVNELKNNLAKESYPRVNNIVVGDNGVIYLTSGRGEKKGPRDRSYLARVYALDAKTGKLLWKFPQGGNLDTNSYWVDVEEKGNYVAFSTMNFDNPGKDRYPGGSIYVLSAQAGKELWHYTVPPIKPFTKTSLWRSPVISPDGNYIGLLTSDGRGLLFNKEGKILWERSLSTPKEINGIPLYAPGRLVYFLDNSVVFCVSNTSEAGRSKAEVPLEHPNSNTVFAYDLAGNLLWKWKAGGYMEEQSFTKDGKYMVCPVAKNYLTKDLSIHGVYLVDISEGKNGKAELKETYKPETQGPIIFADISPDGKYVAGLECPVLLDDGIKTVGKYQVHLWTR